MTIILLPVVAVSIIASYYRYCVVGDEIPGYVLTNPDTFFVSFGALWIFFDALGQAKRREAGFDS
jgi:hypothetical protein